MKEIRHSFDDGAGYERFMGRWSRAVGSPFLDWLASPIGARWLEIGSGTGVFTELILDKCAPATLIGVDPSQAQIDHARQQPATARVNFLVADAQALPFPDGAFDVIASALVINFIPDPPKALSEMCRVVRAGGIVAGYVWDFTAERSPSWPLRRGMRQAGLDVPAVPGTPDSTLATLTALLELAGFEQVVSRSIEVTLCYSDFDDFWQAQTPSYSPITKMIAALTSGERARLTEIVRAGLTLRPDGRIEYSALANAVKALAPAIGTPVIASVA